MVRLRTFGGIIGIVAGASAATAQIPSRLSDTEFRSLITGISEPSGFFRMGNNFTSNETGYPAMISRLAERPDTTGAYLGVGPEQNLSYIAVIRPRIAFIVDIRRQAFLQQLMYKALFEMAQDRAEFLSLLFARPRPVRLDTGTSIQQMWDAYGPVATDTAQATRTMGRIVDHLVRVHGIALDSTDATLIRYVYAMFVGVGPTIRDEPAQQDVAVGYALASSWSSRVVSLTLLVQDSVSGAPLGRADVTYAETSTGVGGQTHGDSTGRYRLPPYDAGVTLRLEVARVGYDAVQVALRLDRSTPTIVVRLRRSAACTVDPVTVDACAIPGGRGGVAGRGSAAARALTAGPPVTMAAMRLTYGGLNFASLTGSPQSFLGTEAAFRTVKDLHERNLIVPLVGDFAGPKAIRAVAAYLKEHRTTVSTFYLSNVLGYLNMAGTLRTFFENAATLPMTSTSVFIDSGNKLCPMAAVTAGALAGESPGTFMKRCQ